MKTITLGLHVSHNSSACLIIDGKVVSAVQEERLTRVKQFEGFPKLSIKHVLETAKIKPSDVHYISIAGLSQHIENPFYVYNKDASNKSLTKSVLAKLFGALKGRMPLSGFDSFIYSESGYRNYILSELKLLNFNLEATKLQYFDHHLCHAASAFFQSDSENALVLTQDGRGDFISGTAYQANKNLKKVYRQPSSSSLAQLYAGVTKYLGFTPLKHEGKITGLAAFGKKTVLAEKIQNLFVVLETGELARTNDSDEFKSLATELSNTESKMINATFESYQEFTRFGFIFNKWLSKNAVGMSREDVAFAIQDATEMLLINSIQKTLKYLKIEAPIDICLAGGIFANVKVNQRIRECSPLVKNVFVQPAMGDEGLAIGAALLSLQENGIASEKLIDVYWGNSYTDNEIKLELEKWSDNYTWTDYSEVEIEIAKLLNEGKVVGRFNGAMEFGPRALGNRSILIHPTNKDINDIVNNRLKRTEFMPFAPSVLDFRAKDYFIGFESKHLTADWMTVTYDVFKDRVAEIAAVVHIDNTARPQIVKEATNESYYKILKEFNRLSGLGCVVNTSFNMHEEPIIASPFDAMRAFDLGSVDCLAIGSFIVWKK